MLRGLVFIYCFLASLSLHAGTEQVQVKVGGNGYSGGSSIDLGRQLPANWVSVDQINFEAHASRKNVSVYVGGKTGNIHFSHPRAGKVFRPVTIRPTLRSGHDTRMIINGNPDAQVTFKGGVIQLVVQTEGGGSTKDPRPRPNPRPERKNCGKIPHGQPVPNAVEEAKEVACGVGFTGTMTQYYLVDTPMVCRNGQIKQRRNGQVTRTHLKDRDDRSKCQRVAAPKKSCQRRNGKEVAHGKIFYKKGKKYSKEADLCGRDQTGTVTQFYRKKTEYRCNDGNAEATGNEEEVYVEGEDVPNCQARAKKSCQRRNGKEVAHGNTFYRRGKKFSKEVPECGRGQEGTITKFFRTKTEYRCNDGNAVATGTTEDVYVEGEDVPNCRARAKRSCERRNGKKIAHGDKIFRKQGDRISRPERCVGRDIVGSITKYYQPRAEFKCNDGNFERTGVTDEKHLERLDENSCRYNGCIEVVNGREVRHAEGDRWRAITRRGVQSEALLCDEGFSGEVIEEFDIEQKFICRDGEIKRRKGPNARKEVNVRVVRNTCHANCEGGILHGDRAMIPEKKSQDIECSEEGYFGYTGKIVKTYDIDVEYQCFDGLLEKTDRRPVKRGEPVVENYCQEIPKLSCGEHVHGERWTTPVDTITVPLYCPKGTIGELSEKYDVMQEYVCNDGLPEEVGGTFDGDRRAGTDTCREKPKAGCADGVAHGALYTEKIGEVEKVLNCKDTDKSIIEVFAVVQDYRCIDGDGDPEGDSREGEFLRPVGSCDYSQDELDEESRRREEQRVEASKAQAKAQVCEGMTMTKNLKNCQRMIDSAQDVSSEAMNICAGLNKDVEKNFCVNQAVKSRIYPNEAAFCSKMKGFWLFKNLFKMMCLKTIERPFSESSKTAPRFVEENLKSCENEENDAGKIICLGKFFF